MVWRGAALEVRLRAVAAWLTEHHGLLTARPFVALPTPWEQAHGQVAAWLDAMTDDEFEARERDSVWHDAPEPLATWAAASSALCAVSRLPSVPWTLPVNATRRVPGRKVRQLEHFLGYAAQSLDDHRGPVVDWCAGKAHMGRALAERLGVPLVAIERDADLAAQGERLARAAGLDAHFLVTDALGPDAAAQLSPGRAVLALHACGALHTTLIERTETDRVLLAPCCYDKALDETGSARVLSAVGRALAPRLDVEALRLVHEAPSETGVPELARVRTIQARRLGFDLWLRAARGRDTYTAMPPFPVAWRALDFPTFCARLAVLGGLDPPAAGEPDPAPFEAAGWARLGLVRRRDAVRGLCRRPVEVLLALDRAVALSERGYEVELGEFCGTECTPRNLLLVGRRAG